LHAVFFDTDLMRDIDAPKSSPEEIVRITLNAQTLVSKRITKG